MTTKLPAINVDPAALKARVKELEAEKSALKAKLDDLRKAQNSVIVKTQTEVVNVGGGPQGLNRERGDKGGGGDGGSEPQIIYQNVGADPALVAKLEAENEQLRADIKANKEFLDSHKNEKEGKETLREQLKKYTDKIEYYKKDNEKTRKALAMLTK